MGFCGLEQMWRWGVLQMEDPKPLQIFSPFRKPMVGHMIFRQTHWAQFIATNKERFMELPELACWKMILLQMVLACFPMYKVGPSPRAIWNPMISIVSKFKSNLRLIHTCSDYIIIHI
jgi:hypothetical protein